MRWRSMHRSEHDLIKAITYPAYYAQYRRKWNLSNLEHYCDVIMGTIASQITSLTIVYSTVYSGADQRKYQSSASLAFVRGIHRGPVNHPHKWPVTWKMFPFDDVIVIHLNDNNGIISINSILSMRCYHWAIFAYFHEYIYMIFFLQVLFLGQAETSWIRSNARKFSHGSCPVPS